MGYQISPSSIINHAVITTIYQNIANCFRIPYIPIFLWISHLFDCPCKQASRNYLSVQHRFDGHKASRISVILLLCMRESVQLLHYAQDYHGFQRRSQFSMMISFPWWGIWRGRHPWSRHYHSESGYPIWFPWVCLRNYLFLIQILLRILPHVSLPID